MKHEQKIAALADMPAFDPAKPFCVIPHANGGWSIAKVSCTPAGADVIAAYTVTDTMVSDIAAALLPPTGEDASGYTYPRYTRDAAIADVTLSPETPGPDDRIAFDLVDHIKKGTAPNAEDLDAQAGDALGIAQPWGDPKAVARWSPGLQAGLDSEGYFAKRFFGAPPENECTCELCEADRSFDARAERADDIEDIWKHIEGIWAALTELRDGPGGVVAQDMRSYAENPLEERLSRVERDLKTLKVQTANAKAFAKHVQAQADDRPTVADTSINERFTAVWDKLRELDGTATSHRMRANVQSARLAAIERGDDDAGTEETQADARFGDVGISGVADTLSFTASNLDLGCAQDVTEARVEPGEAKGRGLTAQDIVDAFRGDQKLYDECLRLLRSGGTG